MPLVSRALIILWLVGVSIYDARSHTIPPWSTWPIILGSALWMAWKGMWAPLALFILFFVWDTTWADIKPLLKQEVREGDDTRWLLPMPVALILVGALILLAGRQGSEAMTLTLGWTIIHGLWRAGLLPGGDTALLMSINALFPTPRFFLVEAAGALVVTIPLLLWRYRRELPMVLATRDVSVLATAYGERSKPQPVGWVFAVGGILLALM